ncbi:MAG: MBOAT family protein, partial [Kiritimatiellae bacterium]|nr:MBOAT family protein [Kiritimatiellia bacterium]
MFFAVVLVAWHASPPKWSAWRKTVLLAANLFFYCWWSPRFAAMLLATAAANHAFAKALWSRGVCARAAAAAGTAPADGKTGASGKGLLVAAVAANLALLAFFKYSGFLFASVVSPAVAALCRTPEAAEAWADFQMDRAFPFLSSVVLPIGISFTSFSAISYVVDSARGTFRPARTFLDFFNYLAFFPKLCAGPIVRAKDLLPAIEEAGREKGAPERGPFARAALLLALGLLKKTVFADVLSQRVVDPFFGDPSGYGAADAAMAVAGYAVQLYCDFSAYTDMATALALLLGFGFPVNFDAPYFSRSLQEFWRRWHVSLSSWLRDYLYIPLGGSRRGAGRTYLNLFLTMLLGGIWHGAGWMFLLWGALHGAGLAAERFVLRRLGRKTGPGIVPVFVFAALAWIPFRIGTGGESLETAVEIFRAFGRISAGPQLVSGAAAAALALGFASQAADASRLDGAA